MSIKPFNTRENLIQKLEERQLSFNKKQLEQVLVNYNYFNIFNGLETIFLESKTPKNYNHIKLENFINLYKFDKEFCSNIMSSLDTIEERLKSSIAYNFSKIHCSTLQDTMQYTNKNNYMDPQDSNPNSPTYCRYSNNYPFSNYQNKNIYDNFSKFIFLRQNFLTTLINKNDHIDLYFYQDSSYVAPAGVAVYCDSVSGPNQNVAVPFWVAIETISFGELLYTLNYLQDDVMKEVLKDFNLTLSKRSEFLNMIDILVCLRNHCAHTTLINRFRTEKKYHINSLLIRAFSLSPRNTGDNTVLYLYDVLKVLSYFEDISGLQKPLKKLKRKLILSLGPKRGNLIFTKVLKRMGNPNYSDWKKILKNQNYTI